MTGTLAFILNGRPETVADVAPTTTLLNYLRYQKRLVGTKEGCAEGDCGACTVAVGDLQDGEMRYRAVNACIQFLPMMHGRSVVTVEGITAADSTLHPCQQAIVDTHGSQCGFCTPGFVMSLYVMGLDGAAQDRQQINDGLAGNLCRCTGYGPLIEAAEASRHATEPEWDKERRERERTQLAALDDEEALRMNHKGARYFAPVTADEFARLYENNPDATILGGATDVGLWVTKQDRTLPIIISIGRVRDLHEVQVEDDKIWIGAAATYTDAHASLARFYPDFGELIRRIGAVQIRNAGTIGGNIANGSPIGDTPPALIALGAKLILRKGGTRRVIPLEEFFIDYGKQDRAVGEFVEAVEVPLLDDPARFRCYKISKRFDQDISALLGCFNVRVSGGAVAEARICYGGMAGTPKRAVHVEAALLGKSWTRETVEAALPAFDQDFRPLTDMRGSAEYRMMTARNLLRKYFAETELPRSRTRLVGREAIGR